MHLLPSTVYLQYLSYMDPGAAYAATLHALSGNACILITAGLMYPQNVTTPIRMQSMLPM